MPKAIRKPAYTLHKATGQARVRIEGNDHYLGEYGSTASRDGYDRLVTAWLSKQDVNRCRIMVDDLALLYLDHAQGYYRKDGQPTREFANIRIMLNLLVEFAGRTRAADFGPRQLREFRDSLIGRTDRRLKGERAKEDRRTLSRQYINKLMRYVVRTFKWAAAEELVPVTVWQGLTAVPGLKKGRSAARESRRVRPGSRMRMSRPCCRCYRPRWPRWSSCSGSPACGPAKSSRCGPAT